MTMSKVLSSLLIAQFLSVFADNMVLFTVIAMVLKNTQAPAWYIPALQSVFLLAYVVLAPWVGGLADTYSKPRILLVGNLLKALGTSLLLLQVEPLFAYCLVGAGAAVYSPAKYGILPELAGHQLLVKANSWIEGSTILAILLGMSFGAKLADESIPGALVTTIALFLLSAGITWFLPATVRKLPLPGGKVRVFYQEICLFLAEPRPRFLVLGGSLFWAAAAAVRIILIAWAPLVLMTKTSSDIANLTAFLALGIVVGASCAAFLIPIGQLRRVRIPAYLMGVVIIALGFSETVWITRAVLFGLGMAGGLFIVPINAAIQELGQQSIGSGGAVAMQNLFQNASMLLSVALYTWAAAQDVGPVAAFWGLGVLLILLTQLLMRRLTG
jgi:LPLT family lysophospholipid transporter-like MFS transporter